MMMTLLSGLKNNNSLRVILVALAYIGFTQFALVMAFPQSRSLGVWFPAGLALGMMILHGVRVWPAIAIGALISGMMVFLHYNIPFTAESVATISLNAAVITLDPLLALFLLKKFLRGTDPFKYTSNIFLFILITMLTSFLAAALVSLVMTATGIMPGNVYGMYLFSYGIANTVAVFILTPFLVSWAKSFKVNFSKNILIETFLFIVALAAVFSTLLLESVAPTIEKSFSFILMPFIFWLAFRANKQVITLSLVVLALAAIYLTTHQLGPFAIENERESVLILQIFLAIMSITALIINATVQERSNAERALKQFNEKLEQSVRERTKALKEEINTRKATEEKIKISNKKLRKANSELDNFVYSVSHDLRAPIASVLGLVNIAKKENSVKAMRQYLDMVAKSAEQQDAFIQDILNLSRNARLDVMADSVEFEGVVNDIFEQLKFIDNGKAVEKVVSVDQKVPFQSDKSRIKVILNNLISNSIRHADGRSIKVEIDIVVDETIASIVVRDNGQGIGKKHLEHIFKMFYRGTDTTAGSGLGLYIVKETIDKLRGAVSIDSKEGEGTVVKLEIPNLYENTKSTLEH